MVPRRRSSSIVGGLLFDLTGHYFTAFAAGAGPILAAAVFLALMSRSPYAPDAPAGTGEKV